MLFNRTSEKDGDGDAGWVDESRGGLFNPLDMQSQE